jgi:hypothetical protein
MGGMRMFAILKLFHFPSWDRIFLNFKSAMSISKYWFFDPGCWVFDPMCSVLGSGCWVFNPKGPVLDNKTSLLDVRHWVLGSKGWLLDGKRLHNSQNFH